MISLKRIWFLLCVAVVGLCAIAVAANVFLSVKLRTITEDLTHAADHIARAGDIEIALLTYSRESLIWNLTQDPAYLERRVVAKKEFEDLVALETRNDFSPAEKEEHEAIKAFAAQYFKKRHEMESSGRSPEAIASTVSSYLNTTLEHSKKFDDLMLARGDAEKKEAHREFIVAVWFGGLAFFLTLTVLLVGFFFFKRHLYLPLLRLNAVVKRIPTETKIENDAARILELSTLEMSLKISSERLASKRADRLKYLSSIVHDLKNPLNAIALSSELLEFPQKSPTSATNHEYVDIIRRQVEYLNLLVSDILDTSLLESGKINLNLEECDLREPVREVFTLFGKTSARHKIVAHLPERAISVKVDRVRVSQILNNLLSNAIKYSPAGGDVIISLETEKDRAIIKVRDFGLGMSAEDQKIIFEPYKRSKNPTVEAIKGVGIGLYTSKLLAVSLGGEMTLNSELGRGSEFAVLFPLHS